MKDWCRAFPKASKFLAHFSSLSGSFRQAIRFHWRQLRANENFDLIPNRRIAFNFRVEFGEDTVVPGILVAADRSKFIVKSKVSQNPGTRFIASTNFPSAVKRATRLVIIFFSPKFYRAHFVILTVH